MKTVNDPRKIKRLQTVLKLFVCLLLLLAFCVFFSAKWYINVYGDIGFASILYTLQSDLSGVESDLVLDFIKKALVPTVLCTAFAAFILFFHWKKKLVLYVLPKFRLTLFPWRRRFFSAFCVLLSIILIVSASSVTRFDEYMFYILQKSTVFEEEYVDPANTKITFPEKKRNLVYIFLESMENTFLSQQQGGALETGVIPELYDLATENVNFSCNEGVGGLEVGGGSSWTIAAMVSQTAGIPLKSKTGEQTNDFEEDSFLPGVQGITDILHENGYYQTLMVGSDAAFGGRKSYFETHHVDRICDLYTAKEEEVVPEDYYVWWGMEDLHLYRYAKEELTALADKEQPFALFMLTADTHHVGGYLCSSCENSYEHQYENVLSCASKQVSEFLEWMQEQEFYEDTSIVIVGDHPTMDNEYIQTIHAEDFSRSIYNCFVNAAVTPTKEKGRAATSLDLFPTTLASMGCIIEGDRLGLGTNLFSDQLTLGERMGSVILEQELRKNSVYYTKNFLKEK